MTIIGYDGREYGIGSRVVIHPSCGTGYANKCGTLARMREFPYASPCGEADAIIDRIDDFRAELAPPVRAHNQTTHDTRVLPAGNPLARRFVRDGRYR